MTQAMRPLAVITGASSGIGLELAKIAVRNGFDLIIASDENRIHDAAGQLAASGASVTPIQADLATAAGVGTLYAAIGNAGRPVDVLMANAGLGLGRAFLDQEKDEWKRVIDTNIVGTIDIIKKVGNDFRVRNAGRILITGSIAGFMPGTFQAVYNGTKAFLNSFSFALRNELQDTKVTVTCLMPGATDTEFFRRADMMDTKVGQRERDDPADVAQSGFDALMNGEGDVVSGMKNKVMSAVANITPSSMLAEQHPKMAEPGTGKDTTI